MQSESSFSWVRASAVSALSLKAKWTGFQLSASAVQALGAHLPLAQVEPAGQFWSVVHSGLGVHLLPWHTNPALQFASVAHSWHCPLTQTSLCDLHCSSVSHFGYVGGHPVRIATPRTPSASTPKRRDMRTPPRAATGSGRPQPCRSLYRHAVMAVKRNSMDARPGCHDLAASEPRPGVR